VSPEPSLPAGARWVYIRGATLTPARQVGVDISIMAGNLLYAALGMLLMLGGFLLFDKLLPRIDFSVELAKGNVAVGIVIGALFFAIAYIVGRSLN
jgi:putative membrane protein